MSDTKTCTRCLVTLPIFDFPWCKDSRLTAGGRIGSQCRACVSERAKAWQKDNYARALANQKRWREQNRSRWNQSMRKVGTKYRKARQRNTPEWVNWDEIRAIYRRAKELRELGFEVEVDHILPLRGHTVSGLHVPWNLQIIPANVNRKKRNFITHA